MKSNPVSVFCGLSIAIMPWIAMAQEGFSILSVFIAIACWLIILFVIYAYGIDREQKRQMSVKRVTFHREEGDEK